MDNVIPPHLADIGFQRVAPSLALRPFIDWYWAMGGYSKLDGKREAFMHPDGRVGLVFHWGDPLRSNQSGLQERICFDAVTSRSQWITIEGKVEAFGIVFRPGGAYPIFGAPLAELAETDALLSRQKRDSLLNLYDRMGKAQTLATRVGSAESWLMSQLAYGFQQSPAVAHLLRCSELAEGQIAIDELAKKVHLSRRQIERLYQKHLGLSPKKYTQIIRVQTARPLLKQKRANIAEVANACGFFDQSHFTREFEAVVGLTPGAYSRRQHWA